MKIALKLAVAIFLSDCHRNYNLDSNVISFILCVGSEDPFHLSTNLWASILFCSKYLALKLINP